MGKDLGLVKDKLVAFLEKNLPIGAAQEEKEKDREKRRLKSEAEKIRQENEKAIMEIKIKADKEAMALKVKAHQEAEERRQQHELDIEKLKAGTSLKHPRHENTRLEINNKPKPNIPFFDEKVD